MGIECVDCGLRDLSRDRAPEPLADTEPTLIDLVRELREAVGLFAGAMPITPKAAWDEAIEKVKRLNGGLCSECLRKDEQALPEGWLPDCVPEMGRHVECEHVKPARWGEKD